MNLSNSFPKRDSFENLIFFEIHLLARYFSTSFSLQFVWIGGWMIKTVMEICIWKSYSHSDVATISLDDLTINGIELHNKKKHLSILQSIVTIIRISIRIFNITKCSYKNSEAETDITLLIQWKMLHTNTSKWGDWRYCNQKIYLFYSSNLIKDLIWELSLWSNFAVKTKNFLIRYSIHHSVIEISICIYLRIQSTLSQNRDM